MPIATKAFDWEIELALVIGKRARNVSVEDALKHVAAYSVAMTSPRATTTARPRPSTSSIGSPAKATIPAVRWTALVSASTITDPQNIGLKLWVNGELKQNGRSTDMIFTIAEQIATASRIMTLDPGDVLLTGTPAGVGVPKQTFLKVGNKVDAEIENIGRLSVEIMPPNG